MTARFPYNLYESHFKGRLRFVNIGSFNEATALLRYLPPRAGHYPCWDGILRTS